MTIIEDLTDAGTWRINSSFSKQVPGLQLAVDSTSLGNYKLCPQYYAYTNVEGWIPLERSVHLDFGLWVHGALERYEHARSAGASHDDALDAAVEYVLRETWDTALRRPWTGSSTKNRLTLVRTVVWYLDQFGPSDSLQTIQLASGKPAIELSFTMDIGLVAESGEPFMLCGHMDRLATLGASPEDVYIVDPKTTEQQPTPRYWSRYNPDNQMSIYSLAGRVVFDLPVKGIIVDAMQILVGETRFERQQIPRTPAQLDEFLEDTREWIADMQQSALRGHWRKNDKACVMGGRVCEYIDVCKRSPGARQRWLEGAYRRRVWDPLVRRGDI
jgi:hypothetical protein